MKRRWLGVFLSVALATTLPVSGAAANDFSPPSSPGDVTAKAVSGGVRVSWDAPRGSTPPVTHYVVHAGQGSCPVTVPATATSAIMRVVAGQKVVRPEVQAVNALGYSEPSQSATKVNVRGKANSRYRNVQVLEFSDFHGAIEDGGPSIGAALLTTAFARDRAAVPATVVVSGGDQFGGSPVLSAQFDEVPTVKALNLMGLDAATTGNHEHDKALSHLRQMIDISQFPWVISNYSSLKPLQSPKNKPSEFTIIETGGMKVGVVGMNTEETADLTPAGNLSFGADGKQKITISPSTRSVNKAAAKARAAGADVVVAILHQGWNSNVDGAPTGRLIEVSKELKGVDLAFGGHTHQTFASIVDDIPVAQTRNAGIEYSRTQVCLDTQTDTVVGSAMEFVTEEDLLALKPNAKTQALITRYKTELGAKLDIKIGEVSGVFPRGGNPPIERSSESPMGTYIAEALRTKYGTDLAFISGGALRDTFPAAGYDVVDPTLRRPDKSASGPYDVTLGDALGVFPFNNYTVTSTITGKDLWAALENGVSQYPGAGRFPQIAGFRFAFNPSLPVGQRVTSVTTADGTPITADNTVYTVATFDFLANGGDDYVGYFRPETAQVRDVLIDVLVEAIRAETARAGVVKVPEPDGRIIRVG